MELEALKEAVAARGLGTPVTRTNIIEILIGALAYVTKAGAFACAPQNAFC